MRVPPAQASRIGIEPLSRGLRIRTPEKVGRTAAVPLLAPAGGAGWSMSCSYDRTTVSLTCPLTVASPSMPSSFRKISNGPMDMSRSFPDETPAPLCGAPEPMVELVGVGSEAISAQDKEAIMARMEPLGRHEVDEEILHICNEA